MGREPAPQARVEPRQPFFAARAAGHRGELERAQAVIGRQRQHVAERRGQDGAEQLHGFTTFNAACDAFANADSVYGLLTR